MQKLLLATALLSALVWNLAQASEIKGLQLAVGATGTRAEIALDREADYKVIHLKSPDRLVIDLPASSVAHGLRLPAATGVVRSVRTGEPAAGTARIVFDLAQPVAVLKPRIEQGSGDVRLVLEWPGDGVEAAPAGNASAAAASTASAASIPIAPIAPIAATPAASVAATSRTPDAVAAVSSEATSRLISDLLARSAANVAAASSGSAGVRSAGAGTAASASTTATPPTVTASITPVSSTTTVASVPTRVATGIPTRVATGVPTQVAPSRAGATGGSTAAPSALASAARPAAADNARADSAGSMDVAPVKTLRDVMRGGGMRPLVIAIDAGHGGQDPGAIGLNGNKEKDVTLAIARELARQVNATPGLRAFLTRNSDMFIPLNGRARLARGAKADIFVSIHADAAENRSAKGSSVYVLSLKGASSQRARWLADKENSADMIGGARLAQASNTLASVLLDLTQSGHMKASEDAAGHVLDGLKRIGPNHKPHIERANFAVLRTSDTPAMLVETAFISNPDEESRLVDPAYQRNLARAVLDGVNTYFLRQPPPGTMYSARAEAQYGASQTPGIGAAGGGL